MFKEVDCKFSIGDKAVVTKTACPECGVGIVDGRFKVGEEVTIRNVDPDDHIMTYLIANEDAVFYSWVHESMLKPVIRRYEYVEGDIVRLKHLVCPVHGQRCSTIGDHFSEGERIRICEIDPDDKVQRYAVESCDDPERETWVSEWMIEPLEDIGKTTFGELII